MRGWHRASCTCSGRLKRRAALEVAIARACREAGAKAKAKAAKRAREDAEDAAALGEDDDDDASGNAIADFDCGSSTFGVGTNF